MFDKTGTAMPVAFGCGKHGCRNITVAYHNELCRRRLEPLVGGTPLDCEPGLRRLICEFAADVWLEDPCKLYP